MPLPTADPDKKGGVWSMTKEQALAYADTKIKSNRSDRAEVWSKQGHLYGDPLSRKRAIKGGLPICPYGCGREGTLLEIVRQDDGRYIGIFNDDPCSCIFIADIQVGEPPNKQRYEIGPDGEMQLVDG
jgi:hypothetical protein